MEKKYLLIMVALTILGIDKVVAEDQRIIERIRILDEPLKTGFVDFKCERLSYGYGSREVVFSIKKSIFSNYSIRVKKGLNWIEVPLNKEFKELGFEFKLVNQVDTNNFRQFGLGFDDGIGRKFLWLNHYEEPVVRVSEGKFSPEVAIKPKVIEYSLNVFVDLLDQTMKTSEIFINDQKVWSVPVSLDWTKSVERLELLKREINRLKDNLLAELKEKKQTPGLYFGTYQQHEADYKSPLSIYNIAHDRKLNGKAKDIIDLAKPFLQDFPVIDDAQKNNIIPWGWREDVDVDFERLFGSDSYHHIRLTSFPSDVFVTGKSEFGYWKHSYEKVSAWFDLVEIQLNNVVSLAQIEIDSMLSEAKNLPKTASVSPYFGSVHWVGFTFEPNASYQCTLM